MKLSLKSVDGLKQIVLLNVCGSHPSSESLNKTKRLSLSQGRQTSSCLTAYEPWRKLVTSLGQAPKPWCFQVTRPPASDCICTIDSSRSSACLLILQIWGFVSSSVLAWRIPGTAEPGGLPSMGPYRVGHD